MKRLLFAARRDGVVVSQWDVGLEELRGVLWREHVGRVRDGLV